MVIELRDLMIYFSGSECFLRNSFSRSRVLGSLCRFLYGKHIDPDIEFDTTVALCLALLASEL